MTDRQSSGLLLVVGSLVGLYIVNLAGLWDDLKRIWNGDVSTGDGTEPTTPSPRIPDVTFETPKPPPGPGDVPTIPFQPKVFRKWEIFPPGTPGEFRVKPYDGANRLDETTRRNNP